ncbi:MAG TPA: hypothetical protein DIW47_07990 [Bacteroidetes bacterium]|nr:hypothetical protein [Bacteroidota bacterium]
MIIPGFLSCKKELTTDSTSPLNKNLEYGTLVDIDNNRYATIQIGTQNWMAENLKTSRYSNGDSLPYILENWKWYLLDSGAWCYYSHDSSKNALFGKMYNWYAATDPRNICPKGWHVPTGHDWLILATNLGGRDIAGSKMKSTLKGHWYGGNAGATNESGFSALPGGKRGIDASFSLLTYRSIFWATDENSDHMDRASSMELAWNGYGSYEDNGEYKYYGLCIRCVED